MVEALKFVQNYKTETGQMRQVTKVGDIQQHGVAFADLGGFQHDCYNCGEKGHRKADCSNLSKEEHKELKSRWKAKMNRQKQAGGQSHVSTIDETNKQDGTKEVKEGQNHMNVQTVLDYLDGIGLAEIGGPKRIECGMFLETTPKRANCGEYKIFLDTAATQHSVFNRHVLHNIHEVGMVLRQNCNAGVNETSTMGFWRDFLMWLNENGIANLLSVPQLEEDGYVVEYRTGSHYWMVHTPNDFTYHFKKGTGMCKGMSYIYMLADLASYISCCEDAYDFQFHEESTTLVGVNTICKNIERYTKKVVEKATLEHKVQE